MKTRLFTFILLLGLFFNSCENVVDAFVEEPSATVNPLITVIGDVNQMDLDIVSKVANAYASQADT